MSCSSSSTSLARIAMPATAVLLALALIGAPRQAQAVDTTTTAKVVSTVKFGGAGAALGGMHLLA